MSTHYLPRKDKDFLAWIVNFFKYLFPSLARFNFPASEYDLLKTQSDDFEKKLEISEEPASRTKPNIQAKNTARKLLEKTLQQDIKEFLIFNRTVTDEDRDILGLPIYKTTRTPSKVAGKSPNIEFDTSVPGQIGIHLYDKDGVHKRSKPEGQHGAEVASIVSDTPPEKWEDLIHSDFVTRSPLIKKFENDKRGKYLYVAGRWENTRGEKGPWSEIIRIVIP